jgi:cytochrome c2
MKKTVKIAMIAAAVSMSVSTISASDMSGKQLFEAKCTSCHITAHQEDESKLIAPPIMGAVRHAKEKFDTKEETVNFIVDYVQNPTKEKAACEADSIKKFGLMPSQKGVVSPEDLEKIAEYIYDTYPNGGGKGHGRGKGHGKGKHGKGKHGQGHGKGNHGQGHGKQGGR